MIYGNCYAHDATDQQAVNMTGWKKLMSERVCLLLSTTVRTVYM